MGPRRVLVAALALLAFAIFVWQFRRAAVEAPSTGATPAVALSPAGTQLPKIPGPPPPVLERSTLADALNSPATEIRADLRLVSDILDTFRTNFPQTGNPVGANAEITAVLAGKNKLGLALIPPDHKAINRAGELCDRWGTPFFFHAESASRMEIRSAGPDKKMWTADDETFAP
ncbi:MAG: hypothetical protein Q8N18_13880 [Opitutaceae bacterium]|nr:hypothetical protein [Opitutaceae bacterium]